MYGNANDLLFGFNFVCKYLLLWHIDIENDQIWLYLTCCLKPNKSIIFSSHNLHTHTHTRSHTQSYTVTHAYKYRN